MESEAKFGLDGRLYPLIGRAVETDDGPGALIQVLPGTAVVLLDRDQETTVRMPHDHVIPPDRIGPVVWRRSSDQKEGKA